MGLNFYRGTNCTPLELIALDGKKRKTNCADTEGVFLVIQSIPKPKADLESRKRLKKKRQQDGALTMTRKAVKIESMDSDLGEIVLCQSEDGQAALDVHLQDETVWLTQAQMEKLFQRDQSVISRHVNNVFKEGELQRQGNMQKMHIANSDKPVAFYNLDVIISVGYRVKSKRGTQFRIWATSVLKDHLVRGYSLNQRRLAEKGVKDVRQVLSLLAGTLENHNLVRDEGLAVLEVVNRYTRTWQLLLQYD